MGELKADIKKLIPTPTVCHLYDQLRKEILKMFSLKKHLHKKLEKKKQLYDRYQELMKMHNQHYPSDHLQHQQQQLYSYQTKKLGNPMMKEEYKPSTIPPINTLSSINSISPNPLPITMINNIQKNKNTTAQVNLQSNALNITNSFDKKNKKNNQKVRIYSYSFHFSYS